MKETFERGQLPVWSAIACLLCGGACANDALLSVGPGANDAGSPAPAAIDGSAPPPGSTSSPAPSQPHDADSGASGGNDSAAPADAGAAGTTSCATAAPPSSGLAIWLQAGSGYGLDSATGNVMSWADKSGGSAAMAPSASQEPTLVQNGLNGKTVLHFVGGNTDAQQAALERSLPITGLQAMTIVFVNATDVLWKDGQTEWCHYQDCDGDPTTQVQGVRVTTETGCSGTYQHVLWWDGQADPSNPGSNVDWTGVFLTPKQQGIGFRFGNKIETYSPNCCDIEYDENVEWHRPKSIGTNWTETVAVHDHLTNTLYTNTVLAESLPAPGAADGGASDPAVYAGDTLDVGNGFGWVDSNNHGGYVAEVLVYTRALSDVERQQVDAYIGCTLFPGGFPDGGMDDGGP